MSDLFLAVKTGNIAWLEQTMKERTGGVDIYNKEGLCPIHYGAAYCQLQSIHHLIEQYGADPNINTLHDLNALHYVMKASHGKRALKTAVYLIEKGVDVNCVSSKKWTPLHQAADQGLIRCVKLLLLKNADVAAKDYYGHYPHEVAKRVGNKKCYTVLFQAFWNYRKSCIKLQREELTETKALYDRLLREALLQLSAEQKFFGKLTHNNWLENKGYNEKNVKVDHLNCMVQPFIEMDGLKKKVENGGKNISLFVDCSARVERLSLKYNHANANAKTKREKFNYKAPVKHMNSLADSLVSNSLILKGTLCRDPFPKLSVRKEASVEENFWKTSLEKLHFDKKMQSYDGTINIMRDSMANNLRMFVTVDYSDKSKKPTRFSVQIPGKSDQAIGEFPDICSEDITMILNGLEPGRETIYKSCETILDVQSKRLLPSLRNTDSMGYMRFECSKSRPLVATTSN